jgi:hypothetical protein
MKEPSRKLSLLLMFLAIIGLAVFGLALTKPTAAQDPPAGDQVKGLASMQAGAPVAQGIQIPVIINIYPGGTVDRKAIDEANKILKQAGMKMVVVKTNWIDEDSGGDDQWGGDNGGGGGTAGDGEFTRAERDAMREYGSDELNRLPNEKGIKISFGETPSTSSTTPGIAVHRDPTIIVRDRGNSQDTGQTIAHEIGHVMTLGPGHKIDDDTNADNGGHAPNQPGNDGNDNIMAPSNRRTGSHLTPDQIAEMRRRRYVHGKCATQWERAYPATKDPQQYGTTTDTRGDQENSLTLYDLDRVYLTSLVESPAMDVQIAIAGLISPGIDVDAQYILGFDTDANLATGVSLGMLDGVDRLVTVVVSGNLELGPLHVTGQVSDPVSGTVTPLDPPPTITVEFEAVDLDEPAVEMATSLLFTVPKALLNFTAVEAPAIAVAGDSMGALYDLSDIFLFDSERWLDDPELTTLGTGTPVPGSPYPFEVSGLEPNSQFILYLDDTPMLTETLDATGSFAGDFVFPSSLSTDEFYFLTAQDSTGEFAYNITCPEAPQSHHVHLPVILKEK